MSYATANRKMPGSQKYQPFYCSSSSSWSSSLGPEMSILRLPGPLSAIFCGRYFKVDNHDKLENCLPARKSHLPQKARGHVRQLAYEELVIRYGIDFPFETGMFVVQSRHRREQNMRSASKPMAAAVARASGILPDN